MKIYTKTDELYDLLREFGTRQWLFDNKNTKELWTLLSKEDRNTFWFTFEEFDWQAYIKIYYFGIRKYIVHEDPSNIDKAVSKNRK